MFIFRFDILKKLGEGSCGKVQLGICKETEQLVSFKIKYKYLLINYSITVIVLKTRVFLTI